jgi:hypothetical protein
MDYLLRIFFVIALVNFSYSQDDLEFGGKGKH